MPAFRHRRSALAVLLVPLVAVASCATMRRSEPAVISVHCVPSAGPYLKSSLYIDRSNTRDPLNPYSPAEWEKFINEVLIKHVPDGGTVFDQTGWWRRPNGTTFRGIGRTLVMLDPIADSTSHRTGVTAVMNEVKTRYGHQLVIREESLVCATF